MVNRLGMVIIASASACGIANAQSLSNLYVRGGGSWLFSSTTRDDATGYGIYGGIGYVVEGPGLQGVAGHQGSIQLDFRHFGGSANFETYDLTFVERFSLTGKFYFGAGGGMHVSHFGLKTAASNGGGGSGLPIRRPADIAPFGEPQNTQTTFVGEALAGYQFNAKWGVELSAKISPSYHSETTSGVTLLASYKF